MTLRCVRHDVAMSLPLRLATFGLIAVVAVVVAGCTSGDARPNTSTVAISAPRTSASLSASASPSASSSPSPTATRVYPADVPLIGHNVKPGEKPPVYPAAANARTQAAANAFAEFYMHTLDWAYATTNPSYMKHYNGASCGQCQGLATGIHRTSTDGHWYLGGRLTVRDAQATPIRPVTAPADFCSLVAVDVSATSVVDKTGKVFSGDGAYAGDRFKLCARMTTDRGWNVTYLARTS